MTADEKNTIIKLRKAGKSLTQIAEETGILRNTVKTFCRRQGLTGDVESMPDVAVTDKPWEKPCQYCGKPMTIYPGRKEKKFCSDSCRSKYWNEHIGEVRRAAMLEHTCPTCGKTFYAYGIRNRKYCSHDCYVEGRFGGVVCE